MKMSATSRPGAMLAMACMMASAFALSATAADTNYPTKPIRMVLPSGAGSNPDLVARLLAERLHGGLGQEVVIDDRTGANGNIGNAYVVHAAPDGYTLTMTTTAQLTINPAIYPNMGFSPQKDLTPIALVAAGPMVLDVNPALGVNSVQDLIALAKQKPGKLYSGSGGIGSLSHLSLELFKTTTGANITHVPYKSTNETLNDVLSGQIQMMIDTLSTSLGYIQSGRIKALAVTGTRRSALLPDVPTIAEVGVPGYVAENWVGVLGPAKMPPEIVKTLNAAIVKALADPELKKKFEAFGSEPIGGTPQQFAEKIRNETKKWADIVKAANVHVPQ